MKELAKEIGLKLEIFFAATKSSIGKNISKASIFFESELKQSQDFN